MTWTGIINWLPVGLLAGSLVATPADAQTLIPTGAQWTYWDRVEAPPADWKDVDFDDSSWASGYAEFGYGDGDERTVVGVGNHITTYFRHSFRYETPFPVGDTVTLRFRWLRDDGAVIHFNGNRIYRSNVDKHSDGTVRHDDLARSAVYGFSEENRFHEYELTVDSADLAGDNTIAVEIHQASTTSTDISFDFELSVARNVRTTRGPYLQRVTPTTAIVRWYTDAPIRGYVRYAESLTDLATAGRYRETAIGSDTENHTAVLSGLAADTTYYYAVTEWRDTQSPVDLAGLNESYRFTTAPQSMTDDRVTRIWVLGDAGSKDLHAKSVKAGYERFLDQDGNQDDLWLMLGDNAYHHGKRHEFDAAIFRMYPTHLRQRALWSAVGNHDADTDPGPYLEFFDFPTAAEAGGTASGSEFYYSFRQANVHLIALNSLDPDDPGQLAWLESDLEAARLDPDVHWIVAYLHHAPHTKGTHDSDDPGDSQGRIAETRWHLAPLLERYGVDLVLGGHSHVFERSHLVQGHFGHSSEVAQNPEIILDGSRGEPDGSGAYGKPHGFDSPYVGTVYVTNGSGSKIGNESSSYFYGLQHPIMVPFAQPGGGTRKGLNIYGSVRLEIAAHRLSVLFIDDQGDVRDRFAIDKGVAWTPRKRHTQVYLRGSHNGWRADPVDRMTLVSNYTWEMERTFATGDEFKFDIHGDWAHNYGDNNGDGVGDRNGANIQLPDGPGTYRVQLHTVSRRFTINKQ